MKDIAYELYLESFQNEKEAISFSKIILLLRNQRNLRTSRFVNADLESIETIKKLSIIFKNGRQLKKPSLSKSPNDSAIHIIAESWFLVPRSDIIKFFDYHKQSMSAENIIGTYLFYTNQLENL
jgi:hypothetical protein